MNYRASWSLAFMGITRNIKQVTQSACPTPLLLSSINARLRDTFIAQDRSVSTSINAY